MPKPVVNKSAQVPVLCEHIGLTHKFYQESELVSSRWQWPNCPKQPGEPGRCSIPPWGHADLGLCCPGLVWLPHPSFVGCSHSLGDLVSTFKTHLLARTLTLAICAPTLPTQCHWWPMCSPNPAHYLVWKRDEVRARVPKFPLPNARHSQNLAVTFPSASVGFDQRESNPKLPCVGTSPSWEHSSLEVLRGHVDPFQRDTQLNLLNMVITLCLSYHWKKVL